MANTRYPNFVLENKLKDQLATSLSLLDYVTIDDSLTQEAGQIKKVNVYSATGAAEKVAEGEGNTQSIVMSYTTKTYTVGTVQARFVYTDEDEMTDPYLVDGGMKNLSIALTNSITEDVMAEFDKAANKVEYAAANGVTYASFVDAVALLKKEDDENAGIFALCNPAMKAMLRKNLKDELKYVEDHVRTGYIGTVCGVPVRISKAITDTADAIADAVKMTLQRTPPQLLENIQQNGIYLAGGVSLTPNIASYIQEKVTFPVYNVPDPVYNTMNGLVEIMNDKELKKLTFSLKDYVGNLI